MLLDTPETNSTNSKLFLTGSGLALQQAEPEVMNGLISTAEQLLYQYPPPKEDFERLGGGRHASIWQDPGMEDYCFKVMNYQTMKASWKSGRDVTPPSAVIEVKFMDAVRSRLLKKGDGSIMAPVQYGALTAGPSSVIIQERIPEQYDSISRLSEFFEETGTSAFEQAKVAFGRTVNALGFTALRLGAGDLKGECGVVNAGNFLIQRDSLASESDVYVIDLMGSSRVHQTLARGLLGMQAVFGPRV